jgi:hypothetical protein
MPHPRPHPRPLASLAHCCRRHCPPSQSRTRKSRRRHCHGKDTIATTTIDRHCRMTAVASEDDDSHFNAAFAAAIDIAAATADALPSPLHSLQPLPPSSPSQPLSPSSSLPPSPLPPPPPSPLMLPPPPPCPCLYRHHRCSLANVIAPPTLLSMVGCCVVCRSLPAALSAVQICQPPHRAVVDIDNNRYHRHQ